MSFEWLGCNSKLVPVAIFVYSRLPRLQLELEVLSQVQTRSEHLAAQRQLMTQEQSKQATLM